MQCPFCSAQDTRVIDSRIVHESNQVRRRRECVICKERFTTYEVIEFNLPRVIKRDGLREPFNETKVRAGFLRALEKRPVNSDQIEEAMMGLKKTLMAAGDREVAAGDIGDLVMKILSHLDQVAFIRFASVYRSFQNVSEFTDMIADLNTSLEGE